MVLGSYLLRCHKFRIPWLHVGDAPRMVLGGNRIFPDPKIELRSTEMTTQIIRHVKSEVPQKLGGTDH